MLLSFFATSTTLKAVVGSVILMSISGTVSCIITKRMHRVHRQQHTEALLRRREMMPHLIRHRAVMHSA
jgi:hypothetical protein